MATNISPELLKLILAGQTVDGYSLGKGNQIYDPGASAENQTPNYEDVIYKTLEDPTWGQSVWGTWNKDGTYRGVGSGDSDALGLAKFVAGALGMYGAGVGLDSAINGAAAGSAGSGAGLTGWDAAMADAAASGSLTPASFGTAAGATGATGAAGAAGGGAGGGALGGGSALGSVGSALGSLGANGSTVGGLLGAAAGALDSGDKTQSTNRDPWGPAQDFLKQQIAQGQKLSTQYQNQPFSPAQQTAYGNVGGLIDTINANASGLLGLPNANASGQNQFDRSNPNKKLVGSSLNMGSFAPGLLGFLGSK